MNHEFIRRVIPKSTNIAPYTQEDIDLMMSHINKKGRSSQQVNPCKNNYAKLTIFLDKWQKRLYNDTTETFTEMYGTQYNGKRSGS